MVESYSKISNYSTEYTLKSLGIVLSNVDLKINKISGEKIIIFIEEAFTHFNLFISTSAKFVISTVVGLNGTFESAFLASISPI
jgi:hypothetical protein